jgi:hypothetical protein
VRREPPLSLPVSEMVGRDLAKSLATRGRLCRGVGALPAGLADRDFHVEVSLCAKAYTTTCYPETDGLTNEIRAC